MESKVEKVYLDLERELDRARNLGSNMVVAAIPGMGLSHYLKIYAQKYQDAGVVYIDKEGGELGEFNLINLGWDINPRAIGVCREYFRKADLGIRKIKLVMAVTAPEMLGTKEFRESEMASHIYLTYYLKVMDKEDLGLMLKSLDKEVTESEIDLIWQNSAGIAQLAKVLVIGKEKYGQMNREEILTDEAVLRVIRPIWRVVSRCSPEMLDKMGVKLTGLLLGTNRGWSLEIDFDLRLKENGKTDEVRLTRDEAAILRYMMENEGEISREKVADIRWGEGKYDEFSDQAINKAIRRLADKLRFHEILTIPKVGYKLKVKDGS